MLVAPFFFLLTFFFVLRPVPSVYRITMTRVSTWLVPLNHSAIVASSPSQAAIVDEPGSPKKSRRASIWTIEEESAAGAHKNQAILVTDTSSTDSDPAAFEARQLAANIAQSALGANCVIGATAVGGDGGGGGGGGGNGGCGKEDAQLVSVGVAPSLRDKFRICLPLFLKYVLPLAMAYFFQYFVNQVSFKNICMPYKHHLFEGSCGIHGF